MSIVQHESKRAERRCFITANSAWYLYNFRNNLIKHLQNNNWDVVSAAPRDGYEGKLSANRKIPLDIQGASVNPFREIVTLTAIFRMLSREKPNVVLSYAPKVNIYFGLACRLLRIPIIANISGIGIIKTKPAIIRLPFLALYRLALRGESYTFFQNKEDMHSFLSAGVVRRSKCERIMGSGVDLSAFPFHGVPTGPVMRIAYVGRLLASKGLPVLLAAVELCRRDNASLIELHIFGKAPEGRRGVVLASDLQGRPGVFYHGHSESIADSLENTTAVCLPSVYGEGVPRSLIEALALGKIIITTDHAGCRDTVRHGQNGYLVPPADPQALANAIKLAISHHADWPKMAKASRRLAEELFDEKNIIHRYSIRMNKITAGQV